MTNKVGLWCLSCGCDVGGADVVGSKGRDKRGTGCGGFDLGAAALFAVDEAEDSGDDHSGFARGFDGSDG